MVNRAFVGIYWPTVEDDHNSQFCPKLLCAGLRNSIDVIYIDPNLRVIQDRDGFVYPDSFFIKMKVSELCFGMDEEGLSRPSSIQGRATHSAWLACTQDSG